MGGVVDVEIIGNVGGGIGLYFNKYYENKRGVKFKIVEYLNKQRVKILFEEPFIHTKWVESKHIRNGFGIRSPYEKLTLGVGYMGEGVYSSKNSPDSYSIWANMLKRCYSEVFQNRHPSYKGCTVCEEWHDYQVFAEWYVSHNSYGLRYDLDKDLLLEGNRVYSPETCCMIPEEINIAIAKQGNSANGLPIGIQRQGVSTFRADYAGLKGDRYIGAFSSIGEALAAYKKAKKGYILELAEKWKYLVSLEVYESLLSLEI